MWLQVYIFQVGTNLSISVDVPFINGTFVYGAGEIVGGLVWSSAFCYLSPSGITADSSGLFITSFISLPKP